MPYLLIPGAQEISDFACDTGHSKEELQKSIVDLFSQEDVGFDLAKINYDMVEEGWNVKVCEVYHLSYMLADQVRRRAIGVLTGLL